MYKRLFFVVLSLIACLVSAETQFYEQISHHDSCLQFETGVKINDLQFGVSTDLTSIAVTASYDYIISWFGFGAKVGVDVYPNIKLDCLKVGVMFVSGNTSQLIYYSPFFKIGLEVRFYQKNHKKTPSSIRW